MHYMAEYHNAHNDYVLQIRAANQQQAEYHQEALPYLLEVPHLPLVFPSIYRK